MYTTNKIGKLAEHSPFRDQYNSSATFGTPHRYQLESSKPCKMAQVKLQKEVIHAGWQ